MCFTTLLLDNDDDDVGGVHFYSLSLSLAYTQNYYSIFIRLYDFLPNVKFCIARFPVFGEVLCMPWMWRANIHAQAIFIFDKRMQNIQQLRVNWIREALDDWLVAHFTNAFWHFSGCGLQLFRIRIGQQRRQRWRSRRLNVRSMISHSLFIAASSSSSSSSKCEWLLFWVFNLLLIINSTARGHWRVHRTPNWISELEISLWNYSSESSALFSLLFASVSRLR